MIELYLFPTANGFKPLIALEELGLPYRLHLIDIAKGEQFDPAFLAISPNNRIPALRDTAPSDGGTPISIFESGAILIYLAEKGGGLLPKGLAERHDVHQWLFWQVGGLGPNMGQLAHFAIYAREDVLYAKKRFLNETLRLFGVMERRLSDRDYLGGSYSIADVACYPWVIQRAHVNISMDEFPRLQDWTARIAARPAVIQAYEKGNAIPRTQNLDDAAREMLFGQGASLKR
jgi:GST-like protein